MEINAPEKPEPCVGGGRRVVDLTERGIIKVDRSCAIAELEEHEPCKVDMTILAFVGNRKGQQNEERGEK